MICGVSAALVAVAVLLAACGGSSPSRGERDAARTPEQPGRAAVEETFPSQGNDHLVDASQPHSPYNSTPPTSGPHLPQLPRPGVYAQALRPEDLPHFMEHGGVWVLYNCPGGCEADVRVLQDLTRKAIEAGRPVALAAYPTMDARFAAVAWQVLLKLDTLDRGRIEDFVERHACRYNPEGGPFCAGVRGEISTGATAMPTLRPSPGR